MVKAGSYVLFFGFAVLALISPRKKNTITAPNEVLNIA